MITMTSKPIRPVLFIADNFPPVIGGSSTVYEQICSNNPDEIVALSSRINFSGSEKSGISQHDQSCSYIIYRTNALRVPCLEKPHPLFSLFKSVYDEISLMLKIVIKITVICRQHKVKLICVGELIYGGWMVLFARYILRKKTVLYTHGEEITQKCQGTYCSYRGLFLKAAHHIISVSLFCKSQIVSIYQISPDKISVISNGVDTNRFTVGEKNYALLQKHKIDMLDQVILCVGRLVKRKGHQNLIYAIKTLTNCISNVKLIIVGSGPEELELVALTKLLELDHVITFLNNIDDKNIIQYYQSADIFAMPNITMEDGDTEGFGLVFLEANACGKPVVGGQAGGAIEAVIHNETGLLVNGYDIDDITQGLQALIEDKHLNKQISKKAMKYVATQTWKEKARCFKNLTAKMVASTQLKIIHADDAVFSQCVSAIHKTATEQENRLHITVDFEEMFDWADLTKGDETVNGVYDIEKFHSICLDNNIKPTYLITYKVLNSDNAVDFLKSIYIGEYEIGIHIHPWNTPPLIEQINTFNSFQCNLPEYLERAKIAHVISLFERKLGFKPLIHRAGRYGASQQTLNCLKENGIKVDLSPSAGFNFNYDGGPNFEKLANYPIWSDNDKKLLCLPLPYIDFLKGPDSLTKILHEKKQSYSNLQQFIKRMIPSSPVRLSPESNDLQRMILVGKLMQQQGINDYILSVHSTSLYPGGNIYSVNKAKTQENINNVIDYALWSKECLKTINSTSMDAFNHYS